MLLGNQRPNRKQEAPGERGLNISASFPELKAACQGLRAVLVLISPQPQIVVTPRTSWTLNPNFNLHLLEVEVGFLKGPCWSPCTCTHVHTHTRTHTHVHTHTHTHTHTCKAMFWHWFLMKLEVYQKCRLTPPGFLQLQRWLVQGSYHFQLCDPGIVWV